MTLYLLLRLQNHTHLTPRPYIQTDLTHTYKTAKIVKIPLNLDFKVDKEH
jgi:hypothetical protein